MATSILAVPEVAGSRVLSGEQRRPGGRLFGAGWATVLTGYALLVHGYHPYAEDGGLYVAGLKRTLDPTLYSRSPEFAGAYLQHSIFAFVMAWIARDGHLSVDAVLIRVHVATLWLTLYAAWMLAERCFESREARAGAVALLAAWFTLPVAGTSLVLMDPYVTARSFSTPLTLLALCGALEWSSRGESQRRRRGQMLCLASLPLAIALHPLMGGYAVGGVALLLCLRASRAGVRLWGPWSVAGAALATAATVTFFAPAESAACVRAELTRSYWFPSDWTWYELLGLIAPLLIVGAWGFARGKGREDAGRCMSRSAFWTGAMGWMVATVFAHSGAGTHLVARLQPLRCFEIVYLVMTLGLGAAMGEWLLGRRRERWVAALVLLGGVMGCAQWHTYPGSEHIEVARGVPRNQWTRAFEWIRQETPKNALFAIDANYITMAGEDAHGFRAIAERSVLADYSKDGGEAANSPWLADLWVYGQTVQTGLSAKSDMERLRTLRPAGVGWVVLEADARTGWYCPYRNQAVAVCEVPGESTSPELPISSPETRLRQ